MNSSSRPGRLAAVLDHTAASINLTFHDVVGSADELTSPFDSTLESFQGILDLCRRHDLCSRTRLYFDDNHLSLYDLVLDVVDPSEFQEVVVAVPVTSIGEAGKGSSEHIGQASSRGVRFAPHGYSHVRLASYDVHGQRLATPLLGPYADRLAENGRPLTENEVLFQLVESRGYFTDSACSEFVLPYGCYNETTLALNQRLGVYDVLTTADFALDIGQELRPRLLIEASDVAESVEQRLFEEVTIALCPNCD